MKELSIDEKAKRYNEAINTIQNLVKAGIIYEDAAIQVFPELIGSEEEKIRKMVLKAFKIFAEKQAWVGHCLDDIDWDKCIAYLEKQGEQENLQEMLETAKQQGYKEGLRVGRAEIWKQIEKQGDKKPIEWSDEDEKILDYLHVLIVSAASDKNREKLDNWLKDLKNRYAWKPSEEQMWSLSTLINTPQYASKECQETAKELLEQLKKLKEE